MTTWGDVHVGDVVRGADQRGWTVTWRGSATQWALDGQTAPFILEHEGREVAVIGSDTRPRAEAIRPNAPQPVWALPQPLIAGRRRDPISVAGCRTHHKTKPPATQPPAAPNTGPPTRKGIR